MDGLCFALFSFCATVTINDDVVGEAYAHNKKEAKKKAAEKAIRDHAPLADYVSCLSYYTVWNCSFWSSPTKRK